MPAWFKESFLDFEEDIDEATARGKRLMLFFHQAGCPYCNALVEDNLAQPDIEQTVRDNLDVVAINMWGDLDVVQVGGRQFTEKTLAEALGVNYTPTLIFFNESRKVALRLDGYYPPDDFRKALQYVTERKDGELGFAEFMALPATSNAAGELNREDFYQAPPFDLSRSIPYSQPLAVFFEQASCGSCDVLHKQVLADPATREIVKKFDNVQLDMRAQTPVVTPAGEQTTARRWALDLGVQFAPTIVFFDRSGQEVIRTEAMFRTFHTQSIFDYVLTEGYKEQPNFQRYLSDRAERLVEQGIDVNIWGYSSDSKAN
jgi:thioredoxin-related protein